MKKTANGNMYTVALDSTWDSFEQNLEGARAGVFLVTYTKPPSEVVLQAMRATAKSLGYGEPGATFASLRIEPAAQITEALEAAAVPAIESGDVFEDAAVVSAFVGSEDALAAPGEAVPCANDVGVAGTVATEVVEAADITPTGLGFGATLRSESGIGGGQSFGTTGIDGQTPEMLLDPVAIFSLVEGLDPLVVVALDATAASLLGATYKQDILLERAGQLFGRPLVAFSDFASHLANPDAKQRAWRLLKTLPTYCGK